MCGADKGHLRHEAFLFHFVNIVIPQKEKKQWKISTHGCFVGNVSITRWGFNAENCRNRECSSPVCLGEGSLPSHPACSPSLLFSSLLNEEVT